MNIVVGVVAGALTLWILFHAFFENWDEFKSGVYWCLPEDDEGIFGEQPGVNDSWRAIKVGIWLAMGAVMAWSVYKLLG